MNSYGIALAILLPPPFAPGMNGTYGYRDLAPLARRNPGRIAFVAGGESLNPMNSADGPNAVTPNVLADFQKEAAAIVSSRRGRLRRNRARAFFPPAAGVILTNQRPPMHPLLIALTRYRGARRDADRYPHGGGASRHAVSVRPSRRRRQPAEFARKPFELRPLAAHNRDARIVWAHAAGI